MIFVDTSIWFSGLLRDDPRYPAASRVWSEYRGQLVTTDYIVDETLTLLRARHKYDRARFFGFRMFEMREARIEFLTQEDIAAAWRVFRDYSDKEWSFTDCTSKVVMERLGISTALTFDHHFRQFGGITVLP